jgi:hypothetical protein
MRSVVNKVRYERNVNVGVVVALELDSVRSRVGQMDEWIVRARELQIGAVVVLGMQKMSSTTSDADIVNETNARIALITVPASPTLSLDTKKIMVLKNRRVINTWPDSENSKRT